MVSPHHLIVGYLIIATVFLLDRGDFFHEWNNTLQDFRAAQSAREVSGDYVFVAIDAASLRDEGTWPWSRQVHADILQNLSDAGALDVFFDVDFAFPADPAGDAAFADALERSGNAYLPVFQQLYSAKGTERTTNRPFALFADRSWPVLVNVESDQRGAVRFYPFGTTIDGEYIPAAAPTLTGSFSEREDSFQINYAFMPSSVPVLSAHDVANGRFDPDVIAGRSVIVGASAIELGDLFTVPVYGIVPGPLIHALAAETLATGLIPKRLHTDWLFLCLFVILTLLTSRPFRNPVMLISTVGFVLLASEAAAFAFYASRAVDLPTGIFHPSLLAYCTWSLLRRLAKNRRIILRQQQEVANTSARLQQVVADSFDAIAIVDEAGNIEMHSRSAVSLFGTDQQGRLRLPQRLINDALASMSGDADHAVRQYEVLDRQPSIHLEYTVTPSDTVAAGTDKHRKVRIAALSIRDVTMLKEQARQIAFMSSYDELTGALRRGTFLQFLGLRAESNEPFTIVVFNLSRFKTINVVLGRDVGDALLREVVKRLESAELNISAPARIGADTFACYSEFPTNETEAAALADRVRDLINQSYALENAQAKVGVRVGYAVAHGSDAFNASLALSQAEEALDAARLSNDSAPRPYNPVLSRRQFRSREIERALGRALDREEFELWYQPQHRLDDCQLVGSEALIRWTSQTLGQVFPDEFIAISESSGFIRELGAWVLERAVEDTHELPGNLSVAVNVSGVQMMGDGVIGDLEKLLQRTGFPASRLCLELTETVLFDGTGDLVEKMQDIRFRGVSWALDDFGTGYSSLGYLSQLPIDKLKVDKSFTLGLGKDPTAAPILSAVADLSLGLGMTLLCEGVETQAHLDFLRKHRYAEAQGYLFSKPLPFSEYKNYVRDCTFDTGQSAGNG